MKLVRCIHMVTLMVDQQLHVCSMHPMQQECCSLHDGVYGLMHLGLADDACTGTHAGLRGKLGKLQSGEVTISYGGAAVTGVQASSRGLAMAG